MNKSRIGQSTVEYIIMFAIVVGALIIVGHRFFPRVRTAYGHLTGEMIKAFK